MKLEEFYASLCKEADKFLQNYKFNQEKDKENWPDDMLEGEWWEQFYTFQSEGVNDD